MSTDNYHSGLKELFLENVVKPVYNSLIRPALPRKIAVYNTVPVRRPKLLDMTDVYPDYEKALIQHIKNVVTDDDYVIIVGGGLGVSAVFTARQGATVEAYEGNRNRIEIISETLQLNGVQDRVTISHAIVESEVSIDGPTNRAEHLPASKLPRCDTLILDCEGAELNILNNMTILPSKIVMEVHPMFEVSNAAAKESLESVGYEIQEATEEATNRGKVTIMTAIAKEEK